MFPPNLTEYSEDNDDRTPTVSVHLPSVARSLNHTAELSALPLSIPYPSWIIKYRFVATGDVI